jgi:hypothetical protein
MLTSLSPIGLMPPATMSPYWMRVVGGAGDGGVSRPSTTV